MNRQSDINRFYVLLDKLKQKTGFRRLAECHGTMEWPYQGVYFFFEEGETRENSGELRVVRVGTHGLKSGSQATLWDRLRQHKGSVTGLYSGGGNHRGSIFRLHVGTAIKEHYKIEVPTWGVGSSADRKTRQAEHSLELKVSQMIGAMPFLWLKVEDQAGPNSMRGFIERNSIGLLSNCKRQPVDLPSPNWLGRQCANSIVQNSGLWNVNHVEESYNPVFINEMDRLVSGM